MAEEEVKLHGMWLRPYSRRAELALKLKGVAFEYVDENSLNKSPELLMHNPIYKKVPVLLHSGRTVVESAIILQYIDETWPENHPLLPEDPYEKSQARFWVTFIDKCMPAFWLSCWTQGEEQQSFMKEAKEGLGFLEKELEGKKFFGGDFIGVVDIVAGVIAFWLPALQEATGASAALVDKDEHPNLCRWTEDFLGSQAVKESLPQRERFVAYFKAKKEAESAAKAPSTT